MPFSGLHHFKSRSRAPKSWLCIWIIHQLSSSSRVPGPQILEPRPNFERDIKPEVDPWPCATKKTPLGICLNDSALEFVLQSPSTRWIKSFFLGDQPVTFDLLKKSKDDERNLSDQTQKCVWWSLWGRRLDGQVNPIRCHVRRCPRRAGYDCY